MSTGRKSIAFISSTQTNTVSASGRDELVAVAVVEDALHLLVDEVEQQLDEGLALARHARGRAAHHPPEEAEADDAEQHRRSTSESTCSVQKPPSPTGLVQNVRWWLMYSVGVEFFAGGHRSSLADLVCVAHRNRRR